MTTSRRGTHANPIATTALLVAACTVLAACATQEPAPAPPPPPRALTVSPQRKQSRAQQDRDKADCQSMASSQATSSQTWAQMFTACMSGRGYLVEE